MEKKIKKCVVVKLGSSITTTQRQKLNIFRLVEFVKQISMLSKKGYFVVLVFSGAVVAGRRFLNAKKYSDEAFSQLAAGIGQAYLISQLYEIFKNYNIKIAQVLLTKKDLKDTYTKESLRKILQLAISQRIIVVINENDVVDLNSFGGNDFLASEISQLLGSEYLLFLTDVEGVYSNKMRVIRELTSKNIIEIAQFNNSKNEVGVGGIQSKILAATKAARTGIETIIANGKKKDILIRLLLDKEQVGTKVIANINL